MSLDLVRQIRAGARFPTGSLRFSIGTSDGMMRCRNG